MAPIRETLQTLRDAEKDLLNFVPPTETRKEYLERIEESGIEDKDRIAEKLEAFDEAGDDEPLVNRYLDAHEDHEKAVREAS